MPSEAETLHPGTPIPDPEPHPQRTALHMHDTHHSVDIVLVVGELCEAALGLDVVNVHCVAVSACNEPTPLGAPGNAPDANAPVPVVAITV